jgi:hypothetical protein
MQGKSASADTGTARGNEGRTDEVSAPRTGLTSCRPSADGPRHLGTTASLLPDLSSQPDRWPTAHRTADGRKRLQPGLVFRSRPLKIHSEVHPPHLRSSAADQDVGLVWRDLLLRGRRQTSARGRSLCGFRTPSPFPARGKGLRMQAIKQPTGFVQPHSCGATAFPQKVKLPSGGISGSCAGRNRQCQATR